jgi:hypothetical protein
MSGFIRILKWLAIAVVCVLLGLQFVRPARTNPPVDPAQTVYARLQVPAQVRSILDRSCQDCHANTTRWPWYSNVAPISWMLVDHVNEGRQQLNLSEWGRYDNRRAAKKLEEICDQVTDGLMPIASYTTVHRNAKLSPEDVRILCDWTANESARIATR